MITARKWAGILPCVLGAAMAVSAAASIQPDPADLYETAGRQLQSGNLSAAQATADRLRELVTRHPEWDPGSVYLHELLPPMESRVKRLRSTEKKLEELTSRVQEEPRQPPAGAGARGSTATRQWATSTIDRLRAEREQLIAASLPSSEERAILGRTETYRKSEQFLASEMVRLVEKAVHLEAAASKPENQQLETVQARLEQIKKEMIGSVVERDRQRQRLSDLQTKSNLYEEVLFELLADSPSGSDSKVDLSTVFAAQLDLEVAQLSGKASSRPDHVALRSRLERYERFNRVLTSAGLIDDQGPRIRAFAKAIQKLPRGEGNAFPAPAHDWIGWLLAGTLAGATSAFAWMSVDARRRQRLSQTSSSQEPATESRAGDEGQHAA